MANIKYVGEEALTVIAGYVNKKLTVASSMPISPENDMNVLYIGATTSSYVHGVIYKYNGTTTSWDVVSAIDGIELTQAEYDLLPQAVKENGIVYYINDTGSGLDGAIVYGYYNSTDGKFYKESTYTTEIVGSSGVLYIAKDVVIFYRYNTSDSTFVAISGNVISKNYTDVVRSGNHDLVESNAVANAINQALTSVYTPRGDLACAGLISDLLIEANVGNVYEMSDSGTTSALFIQGAGIPISTGDNVGIIKAGPNTYMYNHMGSAFDLHDYQKKDLSTPIVINGTSESTVEGALSQLNTAKIDKPASTTNGNIVTFNSNGGITDSGKKVVNTFTYDDNELVGAKNILPNNVHVSKTTASVNCVTNADGSVTVDASPSTAAWSYRLSVFKVKAGRYILSDGVGSSDVYTQLVDLSEATAYVSTKGNAEKQVTFANDTTVIGRIFWESGKTFNTTLYPMLRLASDTDGVYQPYIMTNAQMSPCVQAISNRNLLDNPWFTVNQRGLGSYPKPNSGRKYTVDRWSENIHLSVTVNSNGITLTSDDSNANADLEHRFENSMYQFLINRMATLSAKLTDGNIYSVSGIIKPNEIGTIRLSLTNGWKIDVNTSSTNGTIGVYIFSGTNNSNSSITIRAVKLELGGVSTLGMDVPPNYPDELIKCKRFFEKNSWISFVPITANADGYIMYGIAYRYDVDKRISACGYTFYGGNNNGFLRDLTNNTTIPNNEIVLSNSGSYNNRMVQLKVSHASIVSGHVYAFAVGDNVFEINADM